MSETLLQTKLYLPATRSSLVPRAQLLAKLNAGVNGRLTLISAPAGFGKTTLIVAWGRQLAESGNWRLAWFSLDDNDNDVRRFFTYFITALQKIDSRIGQTALELLRSPEASNHQLVLINLLNTLAQATQAIILALDDYHLITNPAIHESITFLLENAPPHFHLLLISRADPPFSLTRLRARHQMTEIRQQDLRFSSAEAEDFLNQLMALDLPETAVSALEKRTEGWVAGLQMAALSLRGQTDTEAYIQRFTSSNRFVFDYLAEEVLARRPEGTREFLLQTAVLDRLCAPLCDAVLGLAADSASSSQPILEQLEQANLFLIPLDDERRWYRYHHLFADLLQQQGQRENPQWARVAHERASNWFEQAGYDEKAIEHALAAAKATTDYERAANLMTQYGASWLRSGEIGKVQLWTERLPAEWQRENPQLRLNYAWSLLFSSRTSEVETTIAHLPPEFITESIDLLILRGTLAIELGDSAQAIALLEKAVARLTAVEATTQNQRMHGIAINSLAYSYHVHGDSARAQHNYQMGITLNRDVGNLFAVMKATLGWGVLLVAQARLHEAQAIFEDGLQTEQQLASSLGMAGKRLVAASQLHIKLAQLTYHWNQLAEAEAHLVDTGQLLTVSNPADECLGLEMLAKLYLAQGQAEAVPPILAKLQEMEQDASLVHVRQHVMISLATTRCGLYRHQPAANLKVVIEQSLPQLATVAIEPLIYARALLTVDRPQEAIPLLEKIAAQTETAGHDDYWLETAVLLCLAYHKMGENPVALAWLGRAVETAVSSGYVRLFVDEGDPLRQLLHQLAQDENAPSYATTLLTHFPKTPTLNTPASPLSPREREVLQLIASGLTNQEIATKLVIAPSTAKRHVINIYNKLEINNRAEATARAYELGLVNLE